MTTLCADQSLRPAAASKTVDEASGHRPHVGGRRCPETLSKRFPRALSAAISASTCLASYPRSVPCSLALVSRPATRLRISGRRVDRRKRRRPRCASSKATTEKGLSTALDGSRKCIASRARICLIENARRNRPLRQRRKAAAEVRLRARLATRRALLPVRPVQVSRP